MKHPDDRPAILAFDTSTEFCSVALLVASGTLLSGPLEASRVAVRHEATGAVSSTRILPAARELLAETGLTLADCGLLAFGAGPGSFTGLRSAVGVVQGLAYGLDLPVVPVSTLLACAAAARVRAPATRQVIAALDARMNQVYWAAYEWDDARDTWLSVSPAALDDPEAIPVPDYPFTLAGNAAAVFGERLALTARATALDGAALPHASQIAWLGWRGLRAGQAVAAAQAAPVYLRDKVALTVAERQALRASAAACAAPGASPAGAAGGLERQ